MYTVKDIAELTSLTSRQVYDRLHALSPVLDGGLRTGSRGAKLLNDQGFALFRRLVELEGKGLSRESAVKVIGEELGGEADNAQQVSPEGVRKDSESVGNLSASYIEALEARIKAQQEEIAFLRRQVEQLTPLALPAPKRGLVAWFRRRKATAGS